MSELGFSNSLNQGMKWRWRLGSASSSPLVSLPALSSTSPRLVIKRGINMFFLLGKLQKPPLKYDGDGNYIFKFLTSKLIQMFKIRLQAYNNCKN